ncbi:MAG: MFS transporter [Leptospirales bacterium]
MRPPHPASLLSVTRALRGVVQGYLLACFLPDLHRMGWTSLELGTALSGGLLADFLLTAAVGPLSDRLSPRRLLLGGEILCATAPLPFLFHPAPLTLSFAIFLAGAGQRSNGSPGPWAPAEQLLLARSSTPDRPFFRFGSTMAWGLAGMSIGAVLSFGTSLSPTTGLAFGMAGLAGISLVNLVLLRSLPRSAKSGTPTFGSGAVPEKPEPVGREERVRLSLLLASNVLGGLSLGLVDPVIAYWFFLRFHAKSGSTALLLAAAFLGAALLSFALSRARRDHDMPGTVLIISAGAFVAGLLLPFSSSMLAAAVWYSVRLAGLKAPGGIRQALAQSLVRPGRGGLASGVHLSSLQGAQIAGPVLAGLLWHSRKTDGPLILGAILSGLSLLVFLVLYRRAGLRGEVWAKAVPGKAGEERKGEEAI